MNTSIWNNIATTPWWEYVIYAWIILAVVMLIASGRRAQIVSMKRIFAAPMVVLAFALIYLYFTITFTWQHIAIWLLALGVGLILGWLQFWWLKIKAMPTEAKLYIPGSYGLLILLPLLLILKFYYHIDLSNVLLKSSPTHYGAMVLALSGLFAGVLFGRLTYALRCFKKGPYHLTPTSH